MQQSMGPFELRVPFLGLGVDHSLNDNVFVGIISEKRARKHSMGLASAGGTWSKQLQSLGTENHFVTYFAIDLL